LVREDVHDTPTSKREDKEADDGVSIIYTKEIMLTILVGLLVSGVITFIVYGAYIILIAFTIWMVVDAGKQDRFWWVVLIIGAPIIGSAAYYLTEKKHEYAKAPVHYVHTSETESQHEQTPKKVTRRKKGETKQAIIKAVDHKEKKVESHGGTEIDNDETREITPTEDNS
jgi:Flp pilus assembly protein TadB